MTQQGLPWFATFISIGTPLSLASCGPGCVREWQRLFLRGRHGPEGRWQVCIDYNMTIIRQVDVAISCCVFCHVATTYYGILPWFHFVISLQTLPPVGKIGGIYNIQQTIGICQNSEMWNHYFTKSSTACYSLAIFIFWYFL